MCTALAGHGARDATGQQQQCAGGFRACAHCSALAQHAALIQRQPPGQSAPAAMAPLCAHREGLSPLWSISPRERVSAGAGTGLHTCQSKCWRHSLSAIAVLALRETACLHEADSASGTSVCSAPQT